MVWAYASWARPKKKEREREERGRLGWLDGLKKLGLGFVRWAYLDWGESNPMLLLSFIHHFFQVFLILENEQKHY